MGEPYAYWQALLRGEPADLELNVIEAGRYWRHKRDGEIIAIAIDPDGLGSMQVRFGKEAPKTYARPAEIEDFCQGTFSYICRQVTTHENYLVWWQTGVWPDDALIDRKPPKPKPVPRKKAAPVPDPAPEKPAPVSAEPVEAIVTRPASTAPAADLAALSLEIRAFAVLHNPPAAKAFYVQVLAPNRPGTSPGDFSIGFYGATEEIARERAADWIAEQRKHSRTGTAQRFNLKPEGKTP